MQRGPFSNQDFILVGKEAIRLMRLSDTTTDILLERMDAYIQTSNLNHVRLRNTRHTAQQYVPGLCGMDEIRYRLLWVNEPKSPFYHVPATLFTLYEQGWIDNGIWCDQVSRVAPQFYTAEIIEAIRAARGERKAITRIVEPLKAKS